MRNDIFNDQETKKEVFFILLKRAEISTIELYLYGWKDLVVNIPAQEMFGKVAINVVRKNEGLNTIKFLIEKCGYKFREIYDPGHCNLLQEACLYNAIDIVKYLLEKGFNPNTQDTLGITPLHRAIHTDSKGLISLLYSKGANLNTKDKQGLTPLHTAAINLKSNALIELRRLKANARIKEKNGMDYLQLSKAVKEGRIKVAKQYELGDQQKQDNEFREIDGLSQYYKALLEKKIFQKKFEDATELLETAYTLNKTNSFLLSTLVDCFVVSKSINAKQLGIYLDHLINKYKLSKNYIIIGYFHVCEVLKNIGEYSAIEQFIDFAIKMVSSFEEREVKNISISELYNHACSLYFELGSYHKVVVTAQLGLKYCLPNEDKRIVGFLHYNLGRAQFNLFNVESAYSNFEAAFSLVEDDIDIFNSFLSRLIERKEYDKALRISTESKCNIYPDLSITYIKLLKGDITWELALKEASNRKYLNDNFSYSLALDIQTICHHRLGNHDLALLCIKESFKHISAQKNINLDHAIIKYLHNTISYGFKEEGLKFIETTKDVYQNNYRNNNFIKIFKALTYVENSRIEEAINITLELSSFNINSQLLVGLYTSCSCLVIAQHDSDRYDLAQNLLEKALELDPSNLSAILYKALILFLRGKTSEANIGLSDLDENLVLQIAKSEDFLLEGAEEEVIGAELFDPVKIHLYFQKQKQQAITATANAIHKETKPITSWCISSKVYRENTEGVVHIDNELFSNYYALIDPGISNKLDNQTLKQCQNALEKGICYRKVGQNGVKFINNGPIELKIHGDTRLCTTQVFINEDSKKLIIFDELGHHKSIKRISNRNFSITNIKVPNQQSSEIGYSLQSEDPTPIIQGTPTPQFTDKVKVTLNSEVRECY
ncbi:hypothetical protein NF27_JN00080 [Candidatus Jidaibacter acanthamoeba]|uniref:Uncharacterized protein n=1 Tax=Candidatus Jidaibacter acanthamoebae TaxID=86105 RepID=A0A0C1MQ68_9RICK|nr:ankyrin repeat domain-containing protein [Candidatus Jidaibacter acanthamoeba]KIE04102.1 hypothetical protein NF27_JN00080 [Candidatus Jidaibacter acanthamoeba]